MVRLTDRPDMTLDVYRGRKTTIQPTNQPVKIIVFEVFNKFDDLDSFPDLRGSTQGNLK